MKKKENDLRKRKERKKEEELGLGETQMKKPFVVI